MKNKFLYVKAFDGARMLIKVDHIQQVCKCNAADLFTVITMVNGRMIKSKQSVEKIWLELLKENTDGGIVG